MNDIDALLHGAGERWRDAQPNPPEVDVARFAARGDRGASFLSLAAMTAVAAGVIVVVVAVQLGRSPSVGGVPLGGPPADPGLAEISPSPDATPGGTAASPSPTPVCEVTRPTDPFVPPEGYPTEPPPQYGSAWYGTPALWTMLDRDGETWAHLPIDPDGRLSQKTFWWSTDWVPEADPEPDITVVGTRLDEPWSFRADSGTNASADFGTAMLVGVTLPSPGCWRLTATYLDASLSIVVLVEGD